MSLIATMIGLAAALALLAAGYLSGVRRGRQSRAELERAGRELEQQLLALQSGGGAAAAVSGDDEKLRALLEPLLRQGEAVEHLQAQLRELSGALQERESDRQSLHQQLGVKLEQLHHRPSDADSVRVELQKMLEPLLERDREDQKLRNTVEQLLSAPAMQRQQLGFELSHIETAAGRNALPQLLEGIAAKGFSTVLLSDESGLPLASNQDAKGLDRLAGISSILLLLADRMRRDDAPAPLAVIVHDEANNVALHRLFRVAGQRLLLSAVSPGAVDLAPTSLDPTLAKIESVLSSVKHRTVHAN